MRALVRVALAALSVAAVSLGSAGCAARGTEPPELEVAPPPHPAVPRDRLRVATLNMWGVVVPGLEFPVASHIDERFAELAARLAENAEQLDLVFLQEAWATGARRALLEAPEVANAFPYRVDAVRRPGGSGLVVLSRFPLGDAVSFHRFRHQGSILKFWEGDAMGGKGLLAVRLAIDGAGFWLADTHLIACYPDEGVPETACDAGDPNGEARRKQLEAVHSELAALAGDDPALVVGDFNFTPTSPNYAWMRERAWEEPGELDRDPNRLDYLWTRPGAETAWRATTRAREIFREPVALSNGEETPLSDHPALVADFCLVRTNGEGECLPLGRRDR